MVEKIDLTCPKCSANMTINDDNTEVKCDYCGYKFLIKEEESIENAYKRARELSYAETDGKNRANEESVKRKKRKKTLSIILILFVVLVIPATAVNIIAYYSRELIKNPFSDIEVVFAGIDGEGTAEIVYKNNKDSDILYELSKDDHLSEGEKIRVSVSSEKYRFNSSEKEYIVTGLKEHIKSLDEITEQIRKYLNDKSYNYQIKAIQDSYSFKGTIKELKPYKIYLAVSNKENILFDIFEVKIATKTGNVYTKYVVTEYDNVTYNNSETDLVRYDDIDNIGGIIKAGDSKSFDKNYVGYLVGFENIDDIDEYMLTNISSMSIYKDK